MNNFCTYDQDPRDRDPGPTLLIVDDSEDDRARAELACASAEEANGLKVESCNSISRALDILSSRSVHVVLLDKNLGPDEKDPNQNGIESIPAMLRIQPHLQIIMVTASDDTQDAVRAIKLGAFGYFEKHRGDELLIALINRASVVSRLSLSKARTDCLKRDDSAVEFGGKSQIMRQTISYLEVASENERIVLLTGESGTGKTRAAYYSHEYRSKYLKQADRPFFFMNMGGKKSEIIESELFGHEKNAFTGAAGVKQGFFELANGGTLFLDEIGDASLDLQAKILKVIEEKKFYRVGGSKEIKSRFKLILATNRDLEKMVAEGTFRDDLYQRIAMLTIRMPSLAERKEDIPDIARVMLTKICDDLGERADISDFPSDFINFLTNAPHRGNARGIEQFLTRLMVFSPKQKDGRRDYRNWKSTLGIDVSPAPRSQTKKAITIKDLESLPLDVVGPDFPGLRSFVEFIEDKVLLDAHQKLDGKNKDISEVLKITKGWTSTQMKRIKGGVRGILPAQRDLEAYEKLSQSKIDEVLQ